MAKDFSPAALFPHPKDIDREFEKVYVDSMRDVERMMPSQQNFFRDPLLKALLNVMYSEGAKFVMHKVSKKCREAAKETPLVAKPPSEVH